MWGKIIRYLNRLATKQSYCDFVFGSLTFVLSNLLWVMTVICSDNQRTKSKFAWRRFPKSWFLNETLAVETSALNGMHLYNGFLSVRLEFVYICLNEIENSHILVINVDLVFTPFRFFINRWRIKNQIKWVTERSRGTRISEYMITT